MLTYFYWIVAGALAIPAVVGVAASVLLVLAAVIVGVAVSVVMCVPLIVWLILADARFWKSLTHGNVSRN